MHNQEKTPTLKAITFTALTATVLAATALVHTAPPRVELTRLAFFLFFNPRPIATYSDCLISRSTLCHGNDPRIVF